MRMVHLAKTVLLMAGATWLVTLAVAVSAQTANPPDAAKLKNPTKATAESLAAGKVTFLKYCKFCHGEAGDGKGTLIPKGTTPSSFIDATWDFWSTDGEIFTNIKEGIGPKFNMKAMKMKIMDPDIWNVVNYLRSIGPKTK